MMKNTLQNNESIAKIRRYDLDWLRLIAILILLFYHTGMIYVGWGWHIDTGQSNIVMKIWMLFSHQWRMPLLFFISGAGTYFALTHRSSWQYVSERTQRLFLPLVFGMFVIVPPQIYIERIFRGKFSGSYWEFYPSVLEFIPYPAGSFSWHHLWFVAYLFLFSIISLPLFLAWRKDWGKKMTEKLLKFLAYKGTILLFVLPIILSQVILEPYFPEETHALLDDWAYFVLNLFLFVYGYCLVSDSRFIELFSQQRRILLYATLVVVGVMYSIYGIYLNFPATHEIRSLEIIWDVNNMAVMWFSVVATLAYAYRYFNHPHWILKYANESLYPFYILHQTVILIIGFYVLQWNIGVWAGFWLISAMSLVVCLSLYWGIIRYVPFIRIFFGGKR